jgi:hypothetical protein
MLLQFQAEAEVHQVVHKHHQVLPLGTADSVVDLEILVLVWQELLEQPRFGVLLVQVEQAE